MQELINFSGYYIFLVNYYTFCKPLQNDAICSSQLGGFKLRMGMHYLTKKGGAESNHIPTYYYQFKIFEPVSKKHLNLNSPRNYILTFIVWLIPPRCKQKFIKIIKIRFSIWILAIKASYICNIAS